MIDWTTVRVTKPPVTMSISDNDLQEFVWEPTTPVVTFDRYPCHSQAVERCIKVVTEASQSVGGKNRRDGFIRTRLESGAKMPVFETKRRLQYVTVISTHMNMCVFIETIYVNTVPNCLKYMFMIT